MGRIFKRRRGDDLNREHDDFYEALPYQQQLAYDDRSDVATSSAADRVAQVVYFVLAVIETLLALRFAFMLLGANATNGLVNFVYNASYPLVQPFIGMFDTAIDGVQSFSLATLVAMALYALLAGLVLMLINAFRDRATY